MSAPFQNVDDALSWGESILTGARVRLRGLREADLDDLVDWWIDGSAMVPQAGWAIPQGESGVRDMIREWCANQREDVGFVIETVDGQLVGSISLTGQRPKARSGELAIAIGRPFWNQGYGTDAVRTMTNYAFNEYGLHRVGLTVWAYNTRAIAAYCKVGYVEEGRKRSLGFHNGQWHDLVLMSVLEDEWPTQDPQQR